MLNESASLSPAWSPGVRPRRSQLDAGMERSPDAQQEVQLEAPALWPERRVCLDLDDRAFDALDATFALAEEVHQLFRQRRVAEPNSHLPQSSPLTTLLISL
jgi:hypothetical protein